MLFSNLPIEIVIRIFEFLGFYDLLAISSLDRTCHAIFQNYFALEVAMTEAGVIANRNSCAAMMEREKRLSALTRQETNWRALDARHVFVDIPYSNFFDLSAGFLIVGNTETRPGFLQFSEIAEHELEVVPIEGKYVRTLEDEREETRHRESTGKESKWFHRKVPVELTVEGQLVDLGVCIDEHDLVVLVELASGPGEPSVKLHLNRFSTGKIHEAASKPNIVFGLGMTRVGWQDLSVTLEIVGSYLLLLLSRDSDGDTDVGTRDRLLLFDWKLGKLLVEELSRRDVWQGFTFLNPDIFILANVEKRCLDVIHIPLSLPEPTSIRPGTSFIRLLSFLLPQPLLESFRYDVSLRSEPNPFGIPSDKRISSRNWKSCSRLFTSDPEKSIVQFMITALPVALRFSFVVHRASLLRYVYEAHPWLTSKPLQTRRIPIPSTILWDDWGPVTTRCNFDDTFRMPSISTTAGQRQAFLRGAPGHLVVRDFNPIAVCRAIWEEENGVFDDMGGRRMLVTDTEPVENWELVFASDGSNALPCIEVETESKFDYDGVRMDETHLLGLKRSDTLPGVVSFDLFTF